MSETKSTALPTSGDAAARRSAGPGRWFVRRGDQATALVELTPAARAAALDEDLAVRRAEIAHAAGLAELQRDQAPLEVLSEAEVAEERAAAERIRGLRRQQALAEAVDAAAIADMRRKAAHRAAREEAQLHEWQSRALARRTRLLDPTSRLAMVHRTTRIISALLYALVAVGVAWTAKGVGDALGKGVLGYAVEPLFSIPFLVVMRMHLLAATNRMRFPASGKVWQVVLLEVTLGLGMVLVNVSPYVPGLGHWVDTTELLTHLLPPALIAVAVWLVTLVATMGAELLIRIYVELGQGDKRLSGEQVNLLDRARTIQDLWMAGELKSANPNDPADVAAGPSVSSVMRALGLGKADCQAGVDAWHRVYGRGAATASPALHLAHGA